VGVYHQRGNDRECRPEEGVDIGTQWRTPQKEMVSIPHRREGTANYNRKRHRGVGSGKSQLGGYRLKTAGPQNDERFRGRWWVAG